MSRHHRSHSVQSVPCVVVTVSDTRSTGDDRSGAIIRSALEEAGHIVRDAILVRDEIEAIRSAVAGAAERSDVAAVLVTGGTGVARRDVTIESLAPLWAKELPGFGEIFRALSFAEIGPAAFLSRATAGIIGEAFVAVLPGSPAACELALRRLVIPELSHITDLLGVSPAS